MWFNPKWLEFANACAQPNCNCFGIPTNQHNDFLKMMSGVTGQFTSQMQQLIGEGCNSAHNLERLELMQIYYDNMHSMMRKMLDLHADMIRSNFEHLRAQMAKAPDCKTS